LVTLTGSIRGRPSLTTPTKESPKPSVATQNRSTVQRSPLKSESDLTDLLKGGIVILPCDAS